MNHGKSKFRHSSKGLYGDTRGSEKASKTRAAKADVSGTTKAGDMPDLRREGAAVLQEGICRHDTRGSRVCTRKEEVLSLTGTTAKIRAAPDRLVINLCRRLEGERPIVDLDVRNVKLAPALIESAIREWASWRRLGMVKIPRVIFAQMPESACYRDSSTERILRCQCGQHKLDFFNPLIRGRHSPNGDVEDITIVFVGNDCCKRVDADIDKYTGMHKHRVACAACGIGAAIERANPKFRTLQRELSKAARIHADGGGNIESAIGESTSEYALSFCEAHIEYARKRALQMIRARAIKEPADIANIMWDASVAVRSTRGVDITTLFEDISQIQEQRARSIVEAAESAEFKRMVSAFADSAPPSDTDTEAAQPPSFKCRICGKTIPTDKYAGRCVDCNKQVPRRACASCGEQTVDASTTWRNCFKCNKAYGGGRYRR
jgi:hypothetical protein